MRPLDSVWIGERGDRMPARMQAKGQRKAKRDYEQPETEVFLVDPCK